MKQYKEVRICKPELERGISLSEKEAHALGNITRYRIVKLLMNNELNFKQISERLKLKSESRFFTTVRRHIKILVDADIVAVSKYVEKRGALQRYYYSKVQLGKFGTFPVKIRFGKNEKRRN